jgi:hypothetical protein
MEYEYGRPKEYLEPTTGYAIRYKPVTTTTKSLTVVNGRDVFETPRYATDLLLPFIPKNIKVVWECACGNGKIVKRLEENGYGVLATDIRPNLGIVDMVYNFLTDAGIEQTIDLTYAIITNPPFSIKEEFIDRAMQYGVPFAFLINADYSGTQIKWIREYGCEKIIPTRRIDFITPTGRNGRTSSSQFHSMWLTHGFNLGRTETFVDLPIAWKKERI